MEPALLATEAAAHRSADSDAAASGVRVEIAYSAVWDYVSRRRQEIAEAAGAAPTAGFVIRHNRSGRDAEVDFGEARVDAVGERTKCFVFALRLAGSGTAVHRITTSCGQEASLDGHVHAIRAWVVFPVVRSATTASPRRSPG
ncbi:hypothetical protein ACFWAR_26330 [Streptomyces sp. NPDC059917]|uniref:hypothetical protein n=1 Tax=Streptomyces sp. NPDC059917 TaxID=3347002 RepID=UPI00364D1E5D